MNSIGDSWLESNGSMSLLMQAHKSAFCCQPPITCMSLGLGYWRVLTCVNRWRKCG